MFVFKDFWTFVKNSNSVEQIDVDTFPGFIKLAWKSICILLVIDIVLGIFIVTPLKFYNIYPSIKEIEFTRLRILSITLFLPLLEELTFRLPLRISTFNILASLCILLYLLIRLFILSNRVIALSCSFFIVLVLYQIICKESNMFNSILGILKNRFWVFFYFQALLFGFLHLTNYNLDFKYIYLYPLVALSYIIPGIFWGYLRVRYSSGIYLCIVSHIAVNSLYCLVIFH